MICPTDGVSFEGTCALCQGCFLDAGQVAALAQSSGAPFTLEVRAEKLDFRCPGCGQEMGAGTWREFPAFPLLCCPACGGTWIQQANAMEIAEAARTRGGTLLRGRYALGEPFLECRHSTLYHATDRSTGTLVVVRRLFEASQAHSPEVRQQMLREGHILQRLDHNNIPRVLETVEEDGQVYLVLEDFDGVTLATFQAEIGEGASPMLVRRFLDQLLSALSYLHGMEPAIIHRDLRPDAVILTAHGILKIADFSMARLRESREDAAQTVFRGQGSPIYAAPEQLAGGPSHPAHDIYAVGAILYHLATGQEPPPSMERLRDELPLAGIADTRPDFPRELADVIHAMLEPDPSLRPADVAAVQRMLAATGTQRKMSRPTLLRMREAVRLEAAPESPPSAEAPGPPSPVVPASPVAVAEPVAAVESLEVPEAGKPTGGNGGAHAPAAEAVRPSFLSNLLGFAKRKAGRGDVQISVAEPDLSRFDRVDLSNVELDREVARLLPETVARSIQGVCIARRSPTELTVAVKDPTQVYIYDHVSYATQGRYTAHLVHAEGRFVDLAHEFVYRVPSFYEKLAWLEWLDRKKLEQETLDLKSSGPVIQFGAEDVTSPIIAAVDRVIKEAISIGASDIHMESFPEEMIVRYRIDGVLHEIATFQPKEASAMVKRLKIMANMDIAQDRVTQGGRISVAVAGRELDLRVSVIPVPAGESVVCRLLKKGAFDLTLKDLGFNSLDEERYRKILTQPYGMILVSGPTGSGKSTTLYASLKEIQRPDRKLLTVEDPIEYQMPRISQVQVNNAPKEDEKKVTFARALREFLRQDPDVILVGEIRDAETAAISIQAALTGHLLLSTIHTNDSIGIFARLRDMGAEPYLIASTMVGGVAQRLGRRICAGCKVAVEPGPGERETFEKEGIPLERLFRGEGCQSCHGTGYRGRMAIYEILEINADIRDLVARRAHDDEVREAARNNGFRTLLQDGLAKASQGLITLDEVQRVCMTL